jgi:hypothetical protein
MVVVQDLIEEQHLEKYEEKGPENSTNGFEQRDTLPESLHCICFQP